MRRWAFISNSERPKSNLPFEHLEGQEDIKLPTKVDVELKPADSDSWYYVQSLAQNPRVKTSLPLQKRLISLIKTLQMKWRSRESKLVSISAGVMPCI